MVSSIKKIVKRLLLRVYNPQTELDRYMLGGGKTWRKS